MGGYSFELTCPACGGEPAHIADGRPHGGTITSCVFECVDCRRTFHIRAVIEQIGNARMNRHGNSRALDLASCADHPTPDHMEITA